MKSYVIEIEPPRESKQKLWSSQKYKCIRMYLIFGVHRDQGTSLTWIYGPKELQSLISVWYSFGTLYIYFRFIFNIELTQFNITEREKSEYYALYMYTMSDVKNVRGKRIEIKRRKSKNKIHSKQSFQLWPTVLFELH